MKRILVNLLGAIAIGISAALYLQTSTALAQGMSCPLLTTFTNPTPAFRGWFGIAMTGVGDDRVLIGASGAGKAYLFSTNSTLLATFAKPTSGSDDEFGRCLAAVGSDRVLIGAFRESASATNTGKAYLFSTNGDLLTTFTNSAPAADDFFGWSVAAVGSDQVLIGASGNDTGAIDAGSAYLFAIDGSLLTTFTNPAPQAGKNFGHAVAALGTNRVLIGAPGGTTSEGAAYLFGKDGSLLTAFTNPVPGVLGDSFGFPVVALGGERVLIGAPYSYSWAGAAYLFSSNGKLLTTFTNPVPAGGGLFGSSIAMVGSDRVLIGALYAWSGVPQVGLAYLFSTNGALLTTFTNPTPAMDDEFGWPVSALGTDQILIGAYRDDFGAEDAGVAYLFQLVEPSSKTPNLTIGLTGTNTAIVSWASASMGWILQENTSGLASINWSNVTSGIQDDGTNKSLSVHPLTGSRFYRMFKP